MILTHTTLSYLLAQGAVAASRPDEPAPFWANPSSIFLPVIVVMVFFLLFSSSRQKKQEQRKRDEMLSNMKRGDRVMTAGGILGSVVEVRDSEVVLKVDESSNTKIKFTRDAIKRVISEDETTPATK